jgi:hypothetical protein
VSKEGEHPNCQAIDDFLSAFKLSRPIAKTERINNEKVENAYTASHFNQDTGVGFTAIAWGNGLFKVIIECVGGISAAKHIGELTAKVIEPE